MAPAIPPQLWDPNSTIDRNQPSMSIGSVIPIDQIINRTADQLANLSSSTFSPNSTLSNDAELTSNSASLTNSTPQSTSVPSDQKHNNIITIKGLAAGLGAPLLLLMIVVCILAYLSRSERKILEEELGKEKRKVENIKSLRAAKYQPRNSTNVELNTSEAAQALKAQARARVTRVSTEPGTDPEAAIKGRQPSQGSNTAVSFQQSQAPIESGPALHGEDTEEVGNNVEAEPTNIEEGYPYFTVTVTTVPETSDPTPKNTTPTRRSSLLRRLSKLVRHKKTKTSEEEKVPQYLMSGALQEPRSALDESKESGSDIQQQLGLEAGQTGRMFVKPRSSPHQAQNDSLRLDSTSESPQRRSKSFKRPAPGLAASKLLSSYSLDGTLNQKSIRTSTDEAISHFSRDHVSSRTCNEPNCNVEAGSSSLRVLTGTPASQSEDDRSNYSQTYDRLSTVDSVVPAHEALATLSSCMETKNLNKTAKAITAGNAPPFLLEADNEPLDSGVILNSEIENPLEKVKPRDKTELDVRKRDSIQTYFDKEFGEPLQRVKPHPNKQLKTDQSSPSSSRDHHSTTNRLRLEDNPFEKLHADHVLYPRNIRREPGEIQEPQPLEMILGDGGVSPSTRSRTGLGNMRKDESSDDVFVDTPGKGDPKGSQKDRYPGLFVKY